MRAARRTHALKARSAKLVEAPTHFPTPEQCQLYYVNRDTLFSYHAASEAFLQRLVALYTASHYKNSPNGACLCGARAR